MRGEMGREGGAKRDFHKGVILIWYFLTMAGIPLGGGAAEVGGVAVFNAVSAVVIVWGPRVWRVWARSGRCGGGKFCARVVFWRSGGWGRCCRGSFVFLC